MTGFRNEKGYAIDGGAIRCSSYYYNPGMISASGKIQLEGEEGLGDAEDIEAGSPNSFCLMV